MRQNELVKPSGRYVQLPDCILKDMDNDGEDGLVTLGIYISIANAAFNHRVNKITAKTIGRTYTARRGPPNDILRDLWSAGELNRRGERQGADH